MKRLIVLTIFVVALATSGYSQFIKQGTIIGGGAFEFTSQKNSTFSDLKTSTFSLTPWGGYLVIDNLVAGALLQFSNSTFKSTGSKTTFTDILVGPVARYYLDNGLFAHGQFGFGTSKNKNEITSSVTTETKSNASELRLGAGYAIRITDTVLFEPIAGFLSRSNKNTTSNVKLTDNGFFLMAGLTVFFRSTN